MQGKNDKKQGNGYVISLLLFFILVILFLSFLNFNSSKSYSKSPFK